MKGREGKGPPAAADFLVCFHSRAHLGLLPKPICSPARPPEPSSRHHLHHHHHHHLRPRQTSNRGGGPGGAHGSPLLWAKSKHNNADISEPASPKVTCAGQIKVIRPKPSSCKNWQSLMEEIERLHNNRKHGRRTLGFKRDLVQFLVCLRSIRFHCFGAENGSDNDEDDGEGGEGDLNSCGEDNRTAKGGCDDRNQGSEDVFSKWFMILQENNRVKGKIRPLTSAISHFSPLTFKISFKSRNFLKMLNFSPLTGSDQIWADFREFSDHFTPLLL
ncbi:UNVERIFIED_CONTAM: hypothetical protein Sradi_3856400 [Sesamum radiatum]|uniref:Uncharacterized protein n=1 Tax=Sesamum radiatum TaxID=300843 RepID=A0AAW2Q1H5_SESRA